MLRTKIADYSPLIIGVFLGAVSVIMGKIPLIIAQLSGMTVLGGHVGYLLGALIVSYLNSQKWLKSFISSSLTIIIATVVYYSLICMFRVFHIGFTEDFSSMVEGLIFWSVIGLICGTLSASAMWLVTHIKSKLLCFGIFITMYVGMLVVIYLYHFNIIIRDYSSGYIASRYMISDIFEIAFAIVLTTALLVVAIKKTLFPRAKHNSPK